MTQKIVVEVVALVLRVARLQRQPLVIFGVSYEALLIQLWVMQMGVEL